MAKLLTERRGGRRLADLLLSAAAFNYPLIGAALPVALAGAAVFGAGAAVKLAAVGAGAGYAWAARRRPYHLTPEGRPSAAVQTHPAWDALGRYLRLRVVWAGELDTRKPSVIAIHPHGVLSLSRVALYGPVGLLARGVDFRMLGATPQFLLPLSAELSLACGMVDARAEVAAGVLRAGRSLVVYPGGWDEIPLPGGSIIADQPAGDGEGRGEAAAGSGQPGGGGGSAAPVTTTTAAAAATTTTTLHLARRMGFVKLALQHGADLVPVAVFNERLAYRQVGVRLPWGGPERKRLRWYAGRWGTLLPFAPASDATGLGVVFGAPLRVPHPVPAPTREQVAALHAAYVQALAALWEGHKAAFGYAPHEALVIQ